MRLVNTGSGIKKPRTSTAKRAKIETVSPIRVVAPNGQVSLGKKFAGKQIQIFQENETTLVIKTVVVIPESELWLYTPDNLNRMDKSIHWAESNKRRDNFDEIIEKAEHVKNKTRLK